MFQSHLLPGVIQINGHFHITLKREMSDGIYPLKFPYHPALLHIALKIPIPTQEPGHFIFGTKCQKVTSLEASELFAFLQLYYHSLPSWSIVLHLKQKAKCCKKLAALTAFPTALCHIFRIFTGCPSPPALPVPSPMIPACWVGSSMQTLSLSCKGENLNI